MCGKPFVFYGISKTYKVYDINLTLRRKGVTDICDAFFSSSVTKNVTKISVRSIVLSEDKGVGIVDAMKALYSSEVYSKLEDELQRRGISVRRHYMRNFKQKVLSPPEICRLPE